MTKAHFLLIAAAGLIICCFAVYWGSMKWLKVSEHKAAFERLPDFLDGFKILHISDLHGDDREKMNLDIWETVGRLEFDIAVITGDVIVTYFEEILPHVDGLKRLAERAPVFYVEGNHDRKHYGKITELFSSIGITVLTNETVIFTPEGAAESFGIIGVRDLNSLPGRSYSLGKVLPLFERRETGFTLVLTHEPKLYDEMEHIGPELVLAGHTHGGQLRLPFFPTLYAPRQGFFPKYGDGFYGEGDSKLYISRGIGTTVFPVRFWNRPEITVLELRK